MHKLKTVLDIRSKFALTKVSEDWCFKNVRSTEQWTHGYHRYPAKFLPNLVKKLIEEHTNENDLVVDLFAGCGTTLVESKVHGRPSIGVDVNPVAELITRVKTRPISPEKLHSGITCFLCQIKSFDVSKSSTELKTHEKIDYWFSLEHKIKIAFLYKTINEILDIEVRDFLLVALSNILKNCSRWLQSSTKPQVDPGKNPSDPFIAINLQLKKMLKKNFEFYNELKENDRILTPCEIRIEDARKTSIESKTVSAVITSPPYVTSYEYADIHQLTGFWYEYMDDLNIFRKNFIGTFYSLNKSTQTNSIISQEIVDQLLKKDPRTAKEVANYFNDMSSVGVEMHRILKPNGMACIVIGNTTLKDVKINSAEAVSEIFVTLGFELVNIIKRSIPYKLMPTIRDKQSGKFSKLSNPNSKLVYPEEYILMIRKI